MRNSLLVTMSVLSRSITVFVLLCVFISSTQAGDDYSRSYKKSGEFVDVLVEKDITTKVNKKVNAKIKLAVDYKQGELTVKIKPEKGLINLSKTKRFDFQLEKHNDIVIPVKLKATEEGVLRLRLRVEYSGQDGIQAIQGLVIPIYSGEFNKNVDKRFKTENGRRIKPLKAAETIK